MPDPYVLAVPGKNRVERNVQVTLPLEVCVKLSQEEGGIAPMCLTEQQLKASGLGAMLRAWSEHEDVRMTEGLEKS